MFGNLADMSLHLLLLKSSSLCVRKRKREGMGIGGVSGCLSMSERGYLMGARFSFILVFCCTYLHTYLLSKSVEATRERSVEDVTPEADATRRSNSRRRPKNQLTGFTTQQSKLEYLDRMLLLVGSK